MKKYRMVKFSITAIVILMVFTIGFNVKADGDSCNGNTCSCRINPDKNFKTYNKVTQYQQYQSDMQTYCRKNVDTIQKYYHISLKHLDGKKYKISISPSKSVEGYKDVFKIYSVNGDKNADGTGKEVSAGHPKKFTVSNDKQVIVKMRLIEAHGKYRRCLGRNNRATNEIPDCAKAMIKDNNVNDSWVEVTKSYNNEGEVVKGHAERDTRIDDILRNAGKSTTDFGGHDTEFTIEPPENAGFEKKTRAEITDLKCDIKDISSSRTDDGYYNYTKEKKYYMEEQIPVEDATYHGKQICNKTCQERITVNYGPPVSSEAGFCFEYQVKVTSYVKCSAELEIDTAPNENDYLWCLPHAANSYHDGDSEYQAGPNDIFDACIESCDGGKYSEKCSKKCYKEVYKTSSTKKLSNNNKKLSMKKLSNNWDKCSDNYDKTGHYYRNDNKVIKWHQGDAGLASWYYEYFDGDYSPNRISDTFSYFPRNGFCWGTSTISGDCADTMSWEGCSGYNNSGKKYLNKKGTMSAQAAYKKDVEEWKGAAEKCVAATSCNTSESTYTISIDYKDKTYNEQDNKRRITYPRDTGHDSLYSDENLSTKHKNSTVNRPQSVILAPNKEKVNYIKTNDTTTKVTEENSYSCYNDDQRDGVWYQAEWSFPGRWINNKTHKIQEVEPDSMKGWRYEANKFCSNESAKGVNDKWWQYKELNSTCRKYDNLSNSDIEWNIFADATNFGHFGWKIHLECFYALRDTVCKTGSDGCCSPPSTTNNSSSTSNSSSSAPTKGSVVATVASSFKVIKLDNIATQLSNSARKTGYNWTDAAKNTTKNPNYVVDPVKLAEYIQENAKNTYTKPEYEFTLTTETIQEIRKDTNEKYNQNRKRQKYNNFPGYSEIKTTGISAFQSELITNLVNRQHGKRNRTVGCNKVNAQGQCDNYR